MSMVLSMNWRLRARLIATHPYRRSSWASVGYSGRVIFPTVNPSA